MRKADYLEEFLNSVNFNYNRLVALDLKATKEEILDICFYPLNSNYEPAKTILPFQCTLKPFKHPHLIDSFKKLGTNEAEYTRAYEEGISKIKALEIFEQWCIRKINMLEGRKIMILCHDWGSKRQLLIDWMGPLHFDTYFYFHVRDVMSVALFANDFANIQVERPPYPKVDKAYIYSQTQQEYDRNDTIINAVGIIKIYKLMLHSFFSGFVPASPTARWTTKSEKVVEDE